MDIVGTTLGLSLQCCVTRYKLIFISFNYIVYLLMMQRQKVIFLKYHINPVEFDKSNSLLFKILDFILFAVASSIVIPNFLEISHIKLYIIR